MTFHVEEKERLDLYLAKRLDRSRSQVQKLIEDGFVLVDEHCVKKNYLLRVGERIDLSLPEEESLGAEEMDLEIIYENQHLAVINKPPGITVHPGSGQLHGTLVSGLLALGWPLSDLGGEDRPGIVHRLDKETSGLLLIAKDNATHLYLKNQLQERKIHRKYLALVHGVPKWQEKTVEGYLERNPKKPTSYRMGTEGRFSKSHFKLLEDLGDMALLECTLDTGRTHQLRVHLKSIHHPVLGDRVYGPHKGSSSLKHHCLHAYSLSFRTQEEEEIQCKVKPHEEFEELLRRKMSCFEKLI